jgi:hypothetical protein
VARSSYRVLEQLASAEPEPAMPAFYPCPVCRKPQLLDIDSLQVRVPWRGVMGVLLRCPFEHSV